MQNVRRSEPFTEVLEDLPPVECGERVEKDDGWWRAVRITVSWPSAEVGLGYRTEIDWVPVDPPA